MLHSDDLFATATDVILSHSKEPHIELAAPFPISMGVAVRRTPSQYIFPHFIDVDTSESRGTSDHDRRPIKITIVSAV